jgi:outer membrane protein assembly factor BamD (BamD/ComL family)
MKKYFLTLVLASISLQADYIWKNGKLIDFTRKPWLSMQDHYNQVLKASDDKQWLDLIENGVVLINNYKNSPFVDETRFLVAKAFLEIKDYSRSHDSLGQYLNYAVTPKHYEEVMSMKLELAKAFEDGEIKNLVGLPGIPHWIDAKKEAISLYEEIASALPTSFLAEQAIMGKAGLEIKLNEFRLAISTSEGFLRKYAKSSLAPQAFENIGYCQLKIVQDEFLDPDLLSLAEMNYKKFESLFPSHPKLEVIRNNLIQMKELFASNLVTSARYYKKVKQEQAANFYYKKVTELYPETESAKIAMDMMNKAQK